MLNLNKIHQSRISNAPVSICTCMHYVWSYFTDVRHGHLHQSNGQNWSHSTCIANDIKWLDFDNLYATLTIWSCRQITRLQPHHCYFTYIIFKKNETFTSQEQDVTGWEFSQPVTSCSWLVKVSLSTSSNIASSHNRRHPEYNLNFLKIIYVK